MPSLFPSFHVPKTRKKDAISAQDLQAPKNVIYDFDGSMAVESYIPRKFSVKQMPALPAYDRTGQIARGKRVRSSPPGFSPPQPRYRDSENYTYQNQVPEERPPPVPQKEKRYSSHSNYLIPPRQISSSLTASQTPTEKHLSEVREPTELEKPGHSQHTSFGSYVPYNPYDLYTSYGMYAQQDIPSNRAEPNADCGTSELSLQQSSTFESVPNNDSRSTVESKIYQHADANTSYINSLLHVYLAEDTESCASCSSSVYDNEPPASTTPVRTSQLPPAAASATSYRPVTSVFKIPAPASTIARPSAPAHVTGPAPAHVTVPAPAPKPKQTSIVPTSMPSSKPGAQQDPGKRRVQSESMSSTLSKNSYKSIDFCLDSGADYDKSRFWIPAGDRLQSKRLSSSQIRYSSYSKSQTPESNRSSIDSTKKSASNRWSYAHPPTAKSFNKEKTLPEIVVSPNQRHSTDGTTSGYNYKAKMMQTLQDPSRQNRASMYESQRAVSNPIFQIKQILRNSSHES